ncbi:Protein of unknown function (DUF4005) [Castilleja foliolosa]|uniref:Uncharacterized protein n=1 Tax=Castilleja foliolosa TaxID=1961234 RepID=A0ABD3CAI1_9LAMI
MKEDYGENRQVDKKFLTGKKDIKEKFEKQSKNNEQIQGHNHQDLANNGGYEHSPGTPISTPQPTTPREKRRWSFRRSSVASPAGRQELGSGDGDQQVENESRKHAVAVAVATAAAAAVTQLTAGGGEYGRGRSAEEAAAVKIQSFFRAYLARKALNALKGLVKLQALVRGHLVRKQATATLRCMQALVTVQSRALAQRLKLSEQIKHIDQRPS